MSKEVTEVTDETFQTTVSEGVTLVDFYADWCGPCRMMTPIIAELAAEFASSEQSAQPVKIVKVNTENAPKTTLDLSITSIPSFVVFNKGREVSRTVGVRDKPTLKKMITSAF